MLNPDPESRNLQEGALPDYLADFEAVEVIGCDANTLKLYLGQESAFGVYPHQLKGQGWVSKIPTALVLYQIEEVKLYGIWRITGRQVAKGTQIVTVEAVDSFPPLEEGLWQDLLSYSDEPDEDGYIGYTYPQLLDRPNTEALARLFWDCKNDPTFASGTAPDQPEGDTRMPLQG